MAAQHAVLLVIENGGHERALKDGVSAVEGEQALGIERLGAFVLDRTVPCKIASRRDD
jgi:hypothetical protein